MVFSSRISPFSGSWLLIMAWLRLALRHRGKGGTLADKGHAQVHEGLNFARNRCKTFRFQVHGFRTWHRCGHAQVNACLILVMLKCADVF